MNTTLVAGLTDCLQADPSRAFRAPALLPSTRLAPAHWSAGAARAVIAAPVELATRFGDHQAMGFNRRKMEGERQQVAERAAAAS